jgi:hypothetical protein
MLIALIVIVVVVALALALMGPSFGVFGVGNFPRKRTPSDSD